MPSYSLHELIERLPWPLITLDFEASALDPRSYPIEVGICRWQSLKAPLEVWSSLIVPHEYWLTHGVWSETSAEVHGISRDQLVSGLCPTEIITILNDLAGGQVCYCDGGQYDLDWARKLNAVSSVKAAFKIGDWDMLTAGLPLDNYMDLVKWLGLSQTLHRAGDDAERLMRALTVALGQRPGKAIEMIAGMNLSRGGTECEDASGRARDRG